MSLCFGAYWSHWHPQSDSQLIREISWLLLFQTSFKLFTLKYEHKCRLLNGPVHKENI